MLALGGVVAVVDCAIYFRQPSVRAPKNSDEIDRPLSAIAGMVAGGAFIVVGVLAALGVLTFE